jgi:hypothetical protein
MEIIFNPDRADLQSVRSPRNEIPQTQSLRVVAITLLLKQINKKYLFISYPAPALIPSSGQKTSNPKKTGFPGFFYVFLSRDSR